MKTFTFVYPNRNSIGLVAVLLAMWYAGASQNNGAAYLLCFVLVALAIASAPAAWANVRGLEIRPEPIRPVFAGEQMRLALTVGNPSRKSRFGLTVRFDSSNEAGHIPFLERTKSARTEAFAPALKRGLFERHRVSISSSFPIGFVTARSPQTIQQPAYVYPKAEGGRALPMTFDPARDTREGNRAEGDDYAGVRSWIPGESMRHIDWKAVSRGQPFMTKQWTSDAGHRLVLSWDQLSDLEYESRLSQLARWVIDAENQGLDYGLSIPGRVIQPSRGEQHFHTCLQALAVFPSVHGAIPAPSSAAHQ
jgi:uncharacterized protein (DUF58 family)